MTLHIDWTNGIPANGEAELLSALTPAEHRAPNHESDSLMTFTVEILSTLDYFQFEIHENDKEYFWACSDPDEESGVKFSAILDCQQHAIRWAKDTVLQRQYDEEEAEQDRRYGTYRQQVVGVL